MAPVWEEVSDAGMRGKNRVGKCGVRIATAAQEGKGERHTAVEGEARCAHPLSAASEGVREGRVV